MIIEYSRPETIQEALKLLSRDQPTTVPLGGGTHLNRGLEEAIAVVDLQALNLSSITPRGNALQVGATATLQKVYEYTDLPAALRKAINLEVTHNLRQMATIAGTLVTANGRSPIATVLLALDASLELQELDQAPRKVKLGDWLPVRSGYGRGLLITQVSFPLKIKAAYEYVARTPSDQPIVCAAVVRWDSGRTRVALGGWGMAPLVTLDGPESGGLEEAARSAYSQAEDEWASAEYRQEMAAVLTRRCQNQIST